MKVKILIYSFLCALTCGVASCGKDFLEEPPQDQITVDNFFKTTDQLNAYTASLYGFPWFNFNDKAVYAIGDLLSGNLFTGDGQYVPFMNMSVQQDNPRIIEAWSSLFKVVSMSNGVINILPKKAPADISPELVNRAVGEARFMRALAYFYLVRTWGAVPIIEDSEALATGDFQVPRHRVEDVYKFIISDLEEVEKSCPLSYQGVEKGRVTSGAAKALLAKIYLYQKNYPKARQKAEEVINSRAYDLMENYGDIFKTKNDNGVESIFAWQWVACPDCWGQQNTNQAYFAPFGQGITETGDGWGSLMPSLDIVQAFERDDRRRKACVMMPGDEYPELISKSNPKGYKYPIDNFISNTHANIRKYIVGSPLTPDEQVYFMRTGINTNVLRYAEVLLIHAEAVMAGAGTSSDEAALGSFNRVRRRAGLPEKRTITFDDILKERRVELFLEHDYWYDLGRIDRAKATDIITKQERGAYSSATNIYTVHITPKESDFFLPFPQSETDANPKLLEAPVPYK